VARPGGPPPPGAPAPASGGRQTAPPRRWATAPHTRPPRVPWAAPPNRPEEWQGSWPLLSTDAPKPHRPRQAHGQILPIPTERHVFRLSGCTGKRRTRHLDTSRCVKDAQEGAVPALARDGDQP